MSIEEQIEQALTEGKRIKAMAYELYWFAVNVAVWAVSADIRTIGMAISADYTAGIGKETLSFRCYDLAGRVAKEEAGNYIAGLATEVINQVQACEI